MQLFQDSIGSIKDEGIGFEKPSKSKNNKVPKFFFIYELESDSWKHVIEAMNNKIKYRKQNEIKYNKFISYEKVQF